jgi:probable O-glycosylation ligase (exosortase A-associated)
MIYWVGTWAITWFGAVLGIVRPFEGLLVYIVLSILRPASFWPSAVPPGNYSRIVAIAVLVGWIIRTCGSWRFGRAKWVFISLIAYWAWLVVCAYQAHYQEVAWKGVDSQSRILFPVAIGLTLIKSRKQLFQLAWVLVISQAVIAFSGHISIYLMHSGNWLGNEGLGGYDSNDLAAGMVLVSGVAFGLGIAETVVWRKWVALACAGLCVHATLLSYSRGGMFGLIVCGLVAVLFVKGERRHYKILVSCVLAALFLAGPTVRERFSMIFQKGKNQTADLSAESRTEFWKKGWEVMCQNPVFGLGPGNFRVQGAYGEPVTLVSPYTKGLHVFVAHSLWVQTGTEQGFPGLIFLLAIYSASLIGLFRIFRKPPRDERWYRDAARVPSIGLSGFLVSASFLSIANLEQAYFIILFAGGLLKVSSRFRGNDAEQVSHVMDADVVDFNPLDGESVLTQGTAQY